MLYDFWKNHDRIAKKERQVPLLITANHHKRGRIQDQGCFTKEWRN